MDKHKKTNKHKLKLAEPSNSIVADDNGAQLLLSSENGNISKFPTLLPIDYMTVISQLLNQNNELKNFIIEQATEHKKETAEIVNKVIEQANEHKKDTIEIVNKVIENVKPTNNTINGNVNNNNQKFNINVFLNEQCKDAMNFSDFIKNIEVSREDLENNAQLGFVDGVSKILIESLKQLDRSERPIHCTDIKRETMYIKDEDKWTREEDSSKLNRAIQEVTRKSMISLLDWKEENPDYKDRDSAFSERCIVIQQQSMAAHNRDTYFPKVAKLVAKEVMVDK
jgi:ribosomal protein S7